MAALVLLAGVSVGGFFLTETGDLKRPWLLPVVVALVAVEGATAVKIAKGRGHADSQGHEEALLVFMAVAFSPIAALAVVVAGAIVGNLLARRAPIKSVLNIASFTAAGALGLTAIDLIGGSSEIDARRVVAVLVGVVIFAAITRAAVSGALAVTLRASFARDFLDDLRPTALLLAGDASLGLLAGLAALSHSWTVPFAFVAMLALSFAYAGHAHARRQSQTLDDLVSSSWDGIFLVDGDGLIQLWNPAMSRLCGRSADDVVGERPAGVLDLRDADGESAAGFLAPEGPESDSADESVLRLEVERGARWLRLSRSPLPEKGHSFIVRDFTIERETGEALRQNEERLRLALDAASMGWWELDTVTGSEFWSEGLVAMFGLPPGGFGGHYHDFLACVHPDDRRAVARIGDRALEEGQFAVTYRVLWPDKSVHWLEASGHLIETETGAKMVGVCRDVTEPKTMEANLLHAQKVEAVGQLAAGIAHDFNNMMAVVNGYSELTLNKLDPEDPVRANVEHIAAAGRRAASLSTQLLTFSRKQASEPGEIDLNTVVLGVQQLLPTVLPPGVELVIGAEPDLGTIRGDTGELEQALMNLAINAGHAMPGGGRLTIELANVELDAVAADASGLAAGPCVRLAVSDSGVGMDEATRLRIFEPFFTTKTRGKGTGLGLATVIAIVEQSGGAISVSSALGAGTRFELLFPRAAASGPTDSLPGPGREEAATILLVDDSASLRTFQRLILEEQGYNVLEAESAAEGFQVATAYDGPIQLLLADVVMPHGSGPELARELAPARPEMAVLYSSGFSRAEIEEHGVVPTDACVFKPVTAETLAAAVRDLLPAADPATHGR